MTACVCRQPRVAPGTGVHRNQTHARAIDIAHAAARGRGQAAPCTRMQKPALLDFLQSRQDAVVAEVERVIVRERKRIDPQLRQCVENRGRCGRRQPCLGGPSAVRSGDRRLEIRERDIRCLQDFLDGPEAGLCCAAQITLDQRLSNCREVEVVFGFHV